MKYTHLLPFMDKEELKEIAEQVLNGELKGVKIESLFPFLGKRNLGEIVDLLIEKKEVKTLKRALPFVGKEKVEAIYESASKGELPGFDVESCIPFLDSDRIKEIFRELVKNAPEVDEEDEEDDDDDSDD